MQNYWIIFCYWFFAGNLFIDYSKCGLLFRFLIIYSPLTINEFFKQKSTVTFVIVQKITGAAVLNEWLTFYRLSSLH